MSEELIKKRLTKQGIFVGDYEFYSIGETTLNQLKNYKVIPKKDYGAYSTRKPDGLLVNKSDKHISIIAVIEYKTPNEFRTNKQKREAIEQCNDLCQILDATIGVITDGQLYIWINPQQDDKDNFYKDKTTKYKRSYSYIRNEDKKDLNEPFILQTNSEKDIDKLSDESKNTLYYVDRILSCINKDNSMLSPTEQVDPLGLAKSVWQDIYINTGKEPEKCLYNVVELFIFKFLSDLSVLEKPYDFMSVYKMYEEGVSSQEVLSYYAKNSRQKIKELFPEGEDHTTIFNGTIFVKPSGEAVLSQSNLFKNSLKKYHEFGTLRNIKKEFKTKLFETFLKQSSDKSKLGQFFTPRKVVRAIVDMADVDKLQSGARVCDPFCGVGGFIAETIIKPSRKKDFYPINKKIEPKIIYHGFDKGSDDDEERLIILAKANLLIYLSEIVEKYPKLTKEFAKVFNSIFHYITVSNLGTLKIVIGKEDEKYDLILTNPPYITSGVASIKEEIKSEGLEDKYVTGAKGVDGLALEWILRSLKRNGRAFIVIPESILNISQNKQLRDAILKECLINCIVSLPIKTFFNTPQKTYILGITKKISESVKQDFPVFTYLVSNIGETLDVNRFEIEGKSDLEKAKDLFNSYKGSPRTFPIKEIGDVRCKLQPIEKFISSDFWTTDAWWTTEEKIRIGIEEEQIVLSVDQFKEKFNETIKVIVDLEKELKKI